MNRRLLVALISVLAWTIGGCAPAPVAHTDKPPGVGAAPVTGQDSAATREAEPGNQKKERRRGD